MIGAIIGAVIVYLHYLPHWKETEDPGTKLGVFATDPAIPNTFANLLSEMIGTFVLVFGILAIGANKFADGLNPFIVGFLIVSIGLSLGGTTGYAINPARDLGAYRTLLPSDCRKRRFKLEVCMDSSSWSNLGGSLAGLFHQVVFEGKQNAKTYLCDYRNCDCTSNLLYDK